MGESQASHLKQKSSCCSLLKGQKNTSMCICSQKLRSTTAAFSDAVTPEHLCKQATMSTQQVVGSTLSFQPFNKCLSTSCFLNMILLLLPTTFHQLFRNLEMKSKSLYKKYTIPRNSSAAIPSMLFVDTVLLYTSLLSLGCVFHSLVFHLANTFISF